MKHPAHRIKLSGKKFPNFRQNLSAYDRQGMATSGRWWHMTLLGLFPPLFDSVCRMFHQKLCFQSPKTFTPKNVNKVQELSWLYYLSLSTLITKVDPNTLTNFSQIPIRYISWKLLFYIIFSMICKWKWNFKTQSPPSGHGHRLYSRDLVLLIRLVSYHAVRSFIRSWAAFLADHIAYKEKATNRYLFKLTKIKLVSDINRKCHLTTTVYSVIT